MKVVKVYAYIYWHNFLTFIIWTSLIFIRVSFLLTEVNSKVLFTLILVITTLASGFVTRPYDNIDYEVPADNIHGGDKSLDLGEEDIDTNYEDLPKTSSRNVSKVTNITYSTTTVVYDSDESYDDDYYVNQPQYLFYIHDHINH